MTDLAHFCSTMVRSVILSNSTILLAALGLIIGLVAGWHLGARQLKRKLKTSLAERNHNSLQLLETRKHVKTLSAHVKSSLATRQKQVTLRNRIDQAQDKINQQKRYMAAQEKAHFIENAKLKLALLEARLPAQEATKLRPAKPLRNTGTHEDQQNSFRDAHPRIRAKLEAAGVSSIKQLASLSANDIEALAKNQVLVSLKSKR